MRTKLLSLEGLEYTLAAPSGERKTNRKFQRLQAQLHRAVAQELTDRQRTCVELYFYRQLTEQQVADELGIGKATVCRHLQKAKARLGKVLRYAE